MNIWKYKAGHPSRPTFKDNAGNVLDIGAQIETICRNTDVMLTNPVGYPFSTVPPLDVYDGAFMFTELGDNPSQARVDCWNLIHKLLTRGYYSETCAEYYFHQGGFKGFSHKFIDCPTEW